MKKLKSCERGGEDKHDKVTAGVTVVVGQAAVEPLAEPPVEVLWNLLSNPRTRTSSSCTTCAAPLKREKLA